MPAFGRVIWMSSARYNGCHQTAKMRKNHENPARSRNFQADCKKRKRAAQFEKVISLSHCGGLISALAPPSEQAVPSPATPIIFNWPGLLFFMQLVKKPLQCNASIPRAQPLGHATPQRIVFGNPARFEIWRGCLEQLQDKLPCELRQQSRRLHVPLSLQFSKFSHQYWLPSD
jgi:hypothetical protein